MSSNSSAIIDENNDTMVVTTTTTTTTTEDITAIEALSIGDSYYVDEQYKESIVNYTAASILLLSSGENNNNNKLLLQFRIASHKSAALYKLEQYNDAYDEIQIANNILNNNNNNNENIIIEGLRKGETEIVLRRVGMITYKLSKYQESFNAFVKAKQLAELNNNNNNQNDSTLLFDYNEWITLCQKQLLSEQQQDSPKTTSSAASTTKPVVQTSPTSTSATSPTSAAATTTTTTSPVAAAATTAAKKTSSVITVPKYQYYQNDKFMTIAILETNVQESDLYVDMQEETIVIKLKKQGKEFTVLSGQLYEKIIVDASKVNIKDEKVLIKLRKQTTGTNNEWYELLKKAKKIPTGTTTTTSTAVAATTTTPVATTPTPMDTTTATTSSKVPRPYASHRDWDSIEKDIMKEEESTKPEGDDAMNKLFQQLYANADEDTKRAMIKSYQTSGGTVLSTNWNEVKDKNYENERTAPDGMEWKTWEGDKLPMKKE